MLRKKSGRIEWLEFELLAEFPRLFHGVFLCPLNIADRNNHKKIQKIASFKTLVRGKQCHGRHIEEAPLSQEECDGMMTDQKELGLAIMHADCQAAIFYDPIEEVVAVVHSGWRGSVQNIYGNAIQKLYKRYGSKPENLLVCISPSLGPCCGEFIHYRQELPQSFWAFQHKPGYFDFWEISKSQLIEGGVLPHHIQIASLCTVCNPDDFYSYRRDKLAGRNATIVVKGS